ncbi:hypothetical protein ADINL_0815 [Nitrincola lacisaponensis]|uniref:Uncharacterized protein n=1 Tax=Nitrincola lacisaponensis TaxID=267850 RepID=A0A063Y1M3_9GAMM|nr:hypothetical protein ADINL_0815 [Nitrincola lacisaponensis]
MGQTLARYRSCRLCSGASVGYGCLDPDTQWLSVPTDSGAGHWAVLQQGSWRKDGDSVGSCYTLPISSGCRQAESLPVEPDPVNTGVGNEAAVIGQLILCQYLMIPES